MIREPATRRISPSDVVPFRCGDRERITRGDVMALNVFPVVWGYCIELERTFVLGEPTNEQHQALSAVNQAFEVAKAAVTPGVPMSEIGALSAQILRQNGFGSSSGMAPGMPTES